MTTLGIALIVLGVALVLIGLVFVVPGTDSANGRM
jgi:hypothetical protein